MITVEQLKKQIKEYNFEILTGGDDQIAVDCIRKAEIWIRAKLRKCGVEPDFTDEVDKEALIKRALYELYSFAENEEVARDKKEDAIDLLKAKYGNCVDKDLSQQPEKSTIADPVIAIKPGSDNWQGFK